MSIYIHTSKKPTLLYVTTVNIKKSHIFPYKYISEVYSFVSVCVYKQGLSFQHSQSKLPTEQIYFCEGYQQQQPIVITRCFMGFTQSSDDYTILFNL